MSKVIAPTACPVCGDKGRTVQPVTLESLVEPAALQTTTTREGFRFCAGQGCAVAYYHPQSGEEIAAAKVWVRIGSKVKEAPRPVCYCFDHTVEEIEEEVARTGASVVPASIKRKCGQGLDRCAEMNPKGVCCLGDVNAVVRSATRAAVESDKGAGCCSAEKEKVNDHPRN